MKKTRSQQTTEDLPLQLCSAEGQTLLAYPDAMTQQLRHLIGRLMAKGELPARLALVSALRQEGVTALTLALATILARDWSRRVCAVELNWWWPGLAALPALGETMSPRLESAGAAGVLSGALPLDEALVSTALPNLALLPAGELASERRAPIARSAELDGLLAKLGSRFDHLILDIPAIRATSDAIPLASKAEACLLVIRQGATERGDVCLALDDIGHIPVLGVVLNRVRIATPALVLKLIS